MEFITSVTRETRKLIKNEQIRKNVTKIYLMHDEDYDADFYMIFFKKNTVVNVNEWSYIDETSTMVHTNPSDDINGWLNEIAMVPTEEDINYYGEPAE